jgi:hypothetical protein
MGSVRAQWFVGSLAVSLARRIHPCQAIDVLEMLVERHEIRARFHGLCGDPDIVRWK